MKLNLRHLLLIVILINLLLLSSCFNKVQENQYIEINNIEILNDQNEKMVVEKHSDESIFFFDNNVQSNGIKKMTTPLPKPITYFYATTFTNETQFKFIVYGKCYDNIILKDINLNSYDLENNSTKNNYVSKEIINDGANFIITFIVENPKTSKKYFFSNILLEINGKEKEGYEKGPDKYASGSYGIFLKHSLVETEFEKIINTINDTITTEFKLCTNITKLYEDIRNNDYSRGYFISNNYWLCDIKYKGENIDNTTFTNYEHVCYGYSFLDNKFTDEKECYISQIYCNVEGYYLLGLSLNSTIEEVTTKMKELGLYEQTIELSDEVTRYYYNYDYGYITFYYNSKESKIKSFMIDVHVDPYKYAS